MYIQTTTHLMIAGSRYATREMLDYAVRAVQRAHRLGWMIIVGDNPKGVDMAVAQECRRLKAKIIIAGITNFPRNYGCKHGSYVEGHARCVPQRWWRAAGRLHGTRPLEWAATANRPCSFGTVTAPVRKPVTSTLCSAVKKRT